MKNRIPRKLKKLVKKNVLKTLEGGHDPKWLRVGVERHGKKTFAVDYGYWYKRSKSNT